MGCPLDRRPERLHHQRLIAHRKARRRRQADTGGVEAFSDRATDPWRVSEQRLRVHGTPDGTSLDVLGLQRADDLLRSHVGLGGIEEEDAQPAGVGPPLRLGLERDPGHISQFVGIARRHRAARLHAGVQHPELPRPMPASTLLMR
jgi:hypothetical protein